MLPLADAATSYTDVMSEYDGARAPSSTSGEPTHASARSISCKWSPPHGFFTWGTCCCWTNWTNPTPNTASSPPRVLKELQAKGYETSVDVVSEEGGRFRSIVEPCLPHIDYFIVNEIEAGAVCGTQLRSPEGVLLRDRVEAAAEMLMHRGIGRLCAIHFPEGGYALTRKGDTCWCDAIPVAGKKQSFRR